MDTSLYPRLAFEHHPKAMIRSILHRLPRPNLRSALGLIAALLFATAWFVALRPTYLGGWTAYVIVSGASMQPTLRSGDLVAVRTRASYQTGDIVAYRVPRGEPGEGAVVIHRIVGGSAAAGYVLQGDNTLGPDLWRPHPVDVIGRAWIRVPGAGRVLALLLSPFWLGTLAGTLAASSVLTAGSPTSPPDQLDRRSILENAINQLPEREQHILHLRFREHLSHREIAEQVGISPMQVSRSLSKSADMLREILQ